MPEYDYKCEDCGHRFVVNDSLAHREEKERLHEISCPQCKSTHVKHVIEAVFVTTSRKT